jgi:GxxExxY protein
MGACFNVYKDKGCGFLEAVYQECLQIEFVHQKIPFIVHKSCPLTYRGQLLKQNFQPDFICFDKIILEIKAVARLIDEHRAQVLNYLSATGFALGLLVNFGHFPNVEWERLARTLQSPKFDCRPV